LYTIKIVRNRKASDVLFFFFNVVKQRYYRNFHR
jgi:hypothetical protein